MRSLILSTLLLSGLCQGLEYQEMEIQVSEPAPLKRLSGGSQLGLQGPNGYHWFSSQDGLFRFDGHELIRVYPQSNQQPDFTIKDIAAYKQSLWLSTDKGLTRLDLSSYQLSPIESPEMGQQAAYLNVDHLNRLWLSSSTGNYLYRANQQGFIGYPFAPDKSKTTQAQFTKSAADDNGLVWIASQNHGLQVLDPATGSYQSASDLLPDDTDTELKHALDHGHIGDLAYTKHHTIIVLLEDKVLEISSDFQISQSFVLPKHGPGKESSIGVNISEDRHANIWISSRNGGLYKLSGDRSQLLYQSTDKTKRSHIANLFVDRENTLVLQYQNSVPNFYNITNQFTQQRNIVTPAGQNFSINNIHIAGNGDIVLSNTKGWLQIRQEETRFITAASHNGSSPLLMTTGQNQIWLGSSAGSQLLKTDRSFQNYGKGPALDMGFHQSSGTWIKTDKELLNIQAGLQAMASFQLQAMDNSLSTSSSLAFDQHGNPWLANGKVALAYQQQDHSFTPLPLSNRVFVPGKSKLLIHNSSLFMSGKGVLTAKIIQDSAGLALADIQTIPALTGKTIRSMQLDKHGNLWLLENDGNTITRFNIETEKLSSFSSSRGFPQQAISSNLAFDNKGGLSLASGNQLIYLNDPNLYIDQQSPPIRITSVRVFSEHQALRFHLNSALPLKLDHNDNGLNIHFSNGSALDASELGVEYRLRGNSSQWQQAYANNISLPKLAPGSYVFELRKIHQAGQTQALAIEVTAAPWKSQWAYALYGLICASLLVALALYKWRQYQAQRKADEKIRLYAQGFENVADAFCVCNSQGELFSHNQVFSDLVGAQELNPGFKLSAFRSGKKPLRHYRQAWLQLSRCGHWQGTSWLVNDQGKEVPVNCRATKLQQEEQTSPVYMMVLRDISEQLTQQAKLQQLANYDSLTQLANRHYLGEKIALASVQQLKNSNHKFALFIIGAEPLNKLDDIHSHHLNNLLLIGLADKLKQALPQTATVARLEGMQFAVLIDGYEEQRILDTICQRLLQQAERAIEIDHKSLYCKLSIGVALCPENSKQADELIHCADMAMRTVKEHGGNNFDYYQASMRLRAEVAMDMEDAIDEALKFRAYLPYFQSTVALASGRLVGAEALVRWRKANGEILGPQHFIENAETTGSIIKLGYMMLEKVCQQLAVWHVKKLTPLPMAVNLSAQQLLQPDFIEQVSRIIEPYDFPRQLIEFECSEANLSSEIDTVAKVFRQLQQQGHKVRIDNFGGSDTSLSLLRDLPIDGLKIDRRLISGLMESATQQSLVKSIIGLAQNLGIETTAVGVESQASLDFLQQLACDFCQGYIYGRPLALDQFENSELYKQNNTVGYSNNISTLPRGSYKKAQ